MVFIATDVVVSTTVTAVEQLCVNINIKNKIEIFFKILTIYQINKLLLNILKYIKINFTNATNFKYW